MKRTILMERLLGETRLAVIEDDRLCELYTERPGMDGGAGAIYLGRVENVLPGMNAAFVNIGLEKNGFLSAGDISITDRSLSDKLKDATIGKLVRPGQDVLVQVVKAQAGQKGHRLSCHVTLPGRVLVLLTDVAYVGVSRKITDDAERGRLQSIGRDLIEGTGAGVILRTAAAGASPDALKAEYSALLMQWQTLKQRAETAIAPKLMYTPNALTLRCARDMLDGSVDAVWTDGDGLYEELIERARALSPDKVDLIRRHEGSTPLFDLYRVDTQLDKAMRKYVWLKSGGSLVIEETEAMTVIDVNTGKFTGNKDIAETIYKLNREAAEEIVIQLRLRDIGGIVIVDFIDMTHPAQNEQLLEWLRALAKTDRNRLTVVGMTGLGLVELTRKRERRPLSKQLLHTCSACGGDGVTPSHETTARKILHELWRRRRGGDMSPLCVTACPEVAGWLKTLGGPGGGALSIQADKNMKPTEYTVEVRLMP